MKVCSTTLQYIIILSIIAFAQTIALPQCQTSDFYKTLPMVANETYIMNLDSFFGGYNLEYKVTANSTIQKYISLNNKTRKLKEELPDVQMTGLKTYHLSKIGNTWGQQFITLSQKAGKTIVQYGILNDNTTVPVINNYITVV